VEARDLLTFTSNSKLQPAATAVSIYCMPATTQDTRKPPNT
jgi:hypothetical protein